MSAVATVLWFAIAWVFLLAVIFKHWYANDHRQAEATEEALSRTRQSTDRSHEMDAM